jgi:hypothetical protein
MSSLFGGGAVVITYFALARGDILCLSGAVFCAIFSIMFVIGYIVDTKNFKEEQKKEMEKSRAHHPPAQPKDPSISQTLGSAPKVAPINTPPTTEPQILAPTSDERIE